MKPNEIRVKIKRLKDKLKLDAIMIKNYERDKDAENYKERIAKQQAIILEAEQSIAKIRHQRKTASKRISKIKQSSRYSRKQLTELENYDKIELLKKLAGLLRKETKDGKTDSDTQE